MRRLLLLITLSSVAAAGCGSKPAEQAGAGTTQAAAATPTTAKPGASTTTKAPTTTKPARPTTTFKNVPECVKMARYNLLPITLANSPKAEQTDLYTELVALANDLKKVIPQYGPELELLTQDVKKVSIDGVKLSTDDYKKHDEAARKVLTWYNSTCKG